MNIKNHLKFNPSSEKSITVKKEGGERAKGLKDNFYFYSMSLEEPLLSIKFML